MTIRIETDRKGRKIAFRFRAGFGRNWWRMPLAEAELLLATGAAEQANAEMVEFWSVKR